MTGELEAVNRYIRLHQHTFADRLLELLRIPSISTQAEHREDMQAAARWVADQLCSAGLHVELLPTQGHPAVFADSSPHGQDGPVVLVYGHYDVQPVGDLSAWVSPPFEPAVRDGAVFARGAADNKGQFLAHIFAAQAWKAKRRSVRRIWGHSCSASRTASPAM